MIAAIRPLGRMGNNPCANHIQIDIGHASDEMLPALDGGGMITVFPKHPFAIFPLIVFLPEAAGYQLHGTRQCLAVAAIHRQKVDVIRGDHEIQHLQTIAFFCLKQPRVPPLLVTAESEQEILLVAAVGDVPNLPWDI